MTPCKLPILPQKFFVPKKQANSLLTNELKTAKYLSEWIIGFFCRGTSSNVYLLGY